MSTVTYPVADFVPYEAEHDTASLTDPFAPPTETVRASLVRRKHSRAGVGTLALAMASATALVALFIAAGIIETTTPGAFEVQTPQTVLWGACYFLNILVTTFAIGLAIGAMLETSADKTLAWIGGVINALVLVTMLGLSVIGLLIS